MQENGKVPSLTAKTAESDRGADRRGTRLLGFHQDEDGHWVAELSCGHTQHLRHQPPWQNRAWVMDPRINSGTAFVPPARIEPTRGCPQYGELKNCVCG